MFPEAKLRIISALKANGEVMAMTGTGSMTGHPQSGPHWYHHGKTGIGIG